MSLMKNPLSPGLFRFPRSRGDEPRIMDDEEEYTAFSPLTRG